MLVLKNMLPNENQGNILSSPPLFIKMLCSFARIRTRVFGRVAGRLVKNFEYFDFIRNPQNPTQTITFEYWYWQFFLGINRDAYWPIHRQSRVTGWQNVLVGKGSSPGYMPGSYIQGLGTIEIGKYCIFAPNIGIISANHVLANNTSHEIHSVKMGDYCWMGMNSVILPGVTIGDFTVIAAGSVVTKSFPQGYCVVGGVPAKIIKEIPEDGCIRYDSDNAKYVGYIPEQNFRTFVKSRLSPAFGIEGANSE